MAGVLIKRGKFGDTPGGRTPCEDWRSHHTCQGSTRSQEWGFFLSAFQGNVALGRPWSQTSNLQNVRKDVCWVSLSAPSAVLQLPGQTNTSGEVSSHCPIPDSRVDPFLTQLPREGRRWQTGGTEPPAVPVPKPLFGRILPVPMMPW